MAAAPATPDDGLLMRIGETVGAAIFGAVVALVTFRTRLSKMDDRMTRIESNIETQNADALVWRRLSDRRQIYMLQVLADIAKKIGATDRMSDLSLQLLSDETNDHNDH